MTKEIEQLLKQWDEYADIVEKHIKCRNYRKFRLSYRKAEQCSRQIQFLMRHGHIKGFLEKKEYVKRLVERWNKISDEQIAPWKDEIKSKLDQLKNKRTKTRKINKAYSYDSKIAGRSLKMKAR